MQFLSEAGRLGTQEELMFQLKSEGRQTGRILTLRAGTDPTEILHRKPSGRHFFSS